MRIVATLLAASLVAVGCSADDGPTEPTEPTEMARPAAPDEPTEQSGRAEPNEPAPPLRRGSFAWLIPRPAQVVPAEGELPLVETATIVVDETAGPAGWQAAELLRGHLRPATGLELPIVEELDGDADDAGPAIVFTSPADADELGPEEYELAIGVDGVEVRATTAAGFGWAVQTLRQLLAPEVESRDAHAGTFTLPTGTVRDTPRFAWRGVMLDVARHFFPPEDVKRAIDLAAQYKLNRLHLHLTDDQGWRLQIDAYPELTEVGAATDFDGGAGGHYTKEQYVEIVDYATERGIVVVPEIDMPGHTTAALASVPTLNCPGTETPSVSTGFSSMASSLCTNEEATYDFVETVIGELAELTPGPYIHLGADEATGTAPDDFRRFLERAIQIVRAAGKQPIGWDEMAAVEPGPGTLVQHWRHADNAGAAAASGADVVMSPAQHAYLDMKYDDSTPIGLTWAGPIDTRTAYEWDPATVVAGLPAERIVGLEAPLWTETVTNLAEIEQMMLPRLPGYAEIGWSDPDGRTWDDYRTRLATHAERWTAGGRTFTRDPVVPWDG